MRSFVDLQIKRRLSVFNISRYEKKEVYDKTAIMVLEELRKRTCDC